MSQHIKNEGIHFRFFKDLIYTERLKVYRAFGVLPEDYVASVKMPHPWEHELLDRILAQRTDSGKVAEGYVLALQAVVEIPNERPQLGYTLLDGVGIFPTEDEVHATIKELSLPLGWVSMKVSQLLPGWMLSAAPAAASAATEQDGGCGCMQGQVCQQCDPQPTERAAEPVAEAVKIVDELRSFFAINNNQAMFEAAGKLYAVLAAPASADVGEPVMGDGKTKLSDYLENAVPEETIMDDWTRGYEECKRRLFKIVGHQLRAQASSAVPAKVDEREAFEAWHAERWGKPFRLGQTDQYKMDSSQGKWQAWQARAALSASAEKGE